MVREAIKAGACAEANITVQASDTAYALASEDSFPDVLATSRMIDLMELAAARVMQPILSPNQMSVGVSISVKHMAATPVSANVKAVATYIGEKSKLYRFKVEAFDDAGQIGKGEHVRAIVSTEILLKQAARRKKTCSDDA